MKRLNLAASTLLAAALALPMAARAADAPGVFKVPGTDSTIKFYGYTQLDATVDFSGRTPDYEDYDWATILPAVPGDKTPYGKRAKPQLYLTARTSRFGIQTSTPSKLGNVGVKLEGDFNGPTGFQSETYTNSVVFRLRQAYGTVGNLLVGQTWSTFLDFGAAPDTVDFNGPGTLALVRNPQIRYTFQRRPGLPPWPWPPRTPAARSTRPRTSASRPSPTCTPTSPGPATRAASPPASSRSGSTGWCNVGGTVARPVRQVDPDHRLRPSPARSRSAMTRRRPSSPAAPASAGTC